MSRLALTPYNGQTSKVGRGDCHDDLLIRVQSTKRQSARPGQFASSRDGLTRGSWRLWILVGWLALILIQMTQNYAYSVELGMPWSWGFSLRYAMVEFAFWAFATTAIVRWAQIFPPEGAERGKNVAFLLLLTGATLLAHAAYRVPLHRLIYRDPEPRPVLHLFTFQLIDNSLTDTAIFWAVVGICQAIGSARRVQQREQELTKAQLEMLKAQLQPHFLFNTLNSISWLMRKDVEAADNVLASLSTFLRTTLTIPGSEEVTLREELEVLRLYLDIEQARFQNRLTIITNVDANTLGCRLPGLLLQPIVENAVRHGVARTEGPGVIEMGARREGSSLCLWILDNGPGVSRHAGQREGIGMANTRARLEKYYGPAQSVLLSEPAEGGVRVEIRLPLKVTKDAEIEVAVHETENLDC